MSKPMSALRFSLLLLLATPLLGGCGDRYSTLPVPGVPASEMPALDRSIASSSPEQAQRGMGNHTWFWTRGGGPAQIHYSTVDGRDFVWLVGERRILAGEWRVESNTSANGQVMTQICLRYPGVRRQDLSASWLCRPAGTMFMEMQEREARVVRHIQKHVRPPQKFVLTQTPASLAEVEGRVAATPENTGY
jgi:hypothetical protein